MSDTVLLTGANRGLGLALCRAMLSEGHRVIATCREPETAHELRALVEGGSLEVLTLDVNDPESVADLTEGLKGRRVDVLLNNAGIMHRQATASGVDYDAWLETLAVNTLAPFRLSVAMRDQLLAATNPRVVSISSQMGSIERGGTGSIAYRSSKAALNRAMRSLAEEWQADGIAVVVVHPGWVRTDMGGADAALSAADSAADLTRLITGLSLADTGRFYNHDGSNMPW